MTPLRKQPTRISVLAKELQSNRDVPAFQRYLSASAVMNTYKSQFEVYTRQYPPFSYWRSLEGVPEVSILALAIKIFSVLANLMPEERTISRFTRIDTRDRANQDARTIVAQAKIYQQNRCLAQVTTEKPKQGKAPSIKWCSVKGLFTEPTRNTVIDLTGAKASDQPHLSITAECKAGLEALNAVDHSGAQNNSFASIKQPTLDTHRNGINTRLPFFRDLLTDKPVEGANSIRSLAGWADVVVVGPQGGRKVAGKKIWDGEAEKLVF
ncbi:hypothetical protein DFH07DRAFT_771342 [Mycena maculata]|uniref:Uncharacterized protein n=1 Tax=Mycena maculata TaxID=230809 RepID=A0AAD7NIE2_9AGAR|nr:hypothetical protein DFH07DRAFT_771342 [Mycena maculata]